jgi:hypothetical protein
VVRINPVRLKVVLLGSKNFQQLVRFGTWFVAAQDRVGGERSTNERFGQGVIARAAVRWACSKGRLRAQTTVA